MKVYISGPIAGTTDYLERFAKEDRKLKEKGHEVINPAAVNAMLPESTSYEEYMKMSICMLDMCEGIYLMKGWEKSCKANREYGYAMAAGKVVVE